ncbi:alcohol dehydrogenase catalytic domain-containing protein [Micromonospora sp. M12]
MVDGRIIGHEAVGTVTEIGPGVKNLKVGDRVLVSCVSACGVCRFCRESRYGQCTGGGGWILGNEIDGTQAEFVRVPFADNSTYPVPAGVSDEELLMLADILPTGYEVGVLNGQVRPGDVVAVVGAGPISDCRRSPAPGCSAPAWSSRSTRCHRGWRRPSSSAPTS